MPDQANDEANDEATRNLMRMLGIGTGAGAAAGGLYNLFNPGKNPATGASNMIGQIPGKTQQYYQPYMDAGKGALGNLQNEYKDLLAGNTQGKLGANFKESPGYQFALNQALSGGSNAAAMGGQLGMPAHEQQNMGIAQGLASQDYDRYMQNQMGLYGRGLEGTQGLNTMGYNANTDFANLLANVMGKQADYSYQGQQGQNAGRSQSIKDILGGLGTAAGSYFGGPVGGAAAGAGMNWLTSLFGGH